jgi:Undecaprenyl-phosphate glucose phosphotransferase
MRNELFPQTRVVDDGRLQEILAGHATPAREQSARVAAAPLISKRVLTSLVRLGDSLVAALIGAAIWHVYLRPESYSESAYYVTFLLGVGLVVPILFGGAGLYSIHAFMRPVEQLARLTASWLAIFAALFAILFFAQAGDSYSRVWAATWFLSGLGGLIAFRGIVALWVKRWNQDGRLDRRAVLFGGGKPAEDLIEAIRASQDSDVTIVGIFDDRGDDRSPATVAGLRKLGNADQLVDFVRRMRTDLLIVTLPLTAEARLLEVLKRLWVLPVDIRLSAYTQKLRYRPRAYSYVGNIPLVDIFDKPLSDWGQVAKFLEDRIISFLALILVSPIMLLIALAIKLDSKGPVFFKQKRYGFNNELIEVYKFRSMYTDRTDPNANKLVSKNDSRVTRVGRFIRKTSLDELPQLFNVLRGELSLVGPRPHATHAKAADALYTDVVEGYFARHKVKPGITGWAQINGWRGETDTAEKIERRVEHDLYYIENWSLFFDLYILARTPIALLKSENAY